MIPTMFSVQQWEEARDFLRSLGVPSELLEGPTLASDLDRYLRMLLEKNQAVNLTALRDPAIAFWKHLVDSLSILQWNDLGPVVDWGSGGGLPGIPLALVRRSVGNLDGVSFVDSVGKKVRAIEEFGNALGLQRSHYLIGRGEDLIRKGDLGEAQTVLMRAVAPAERAVNWLNRAVPRWVFLLGPQQLDLWKAERAKVETKGFFFAREASFELPHGHGQRILLELERR